MRSLIFLLVLTSCGKDESSNSNASELEGTWESECIAVDQMVSVKAKAIFTGNKYQFEYRTFLDIVCGSPGIEDIKTASYEMPGSLESDSAIKKLDLTYSSVSLTMKSQTLVDNANELRRFGFNDWKLNESKDVSGKKDDQDSSAEPVVNEKRFTIYKLADSKLYVASSSDTADQKSNETRPKTLSDKPLVRK